MTARDDIVERSDTRLHESLIHILTDISRRRAVKRQVAAFRADDELFAFDTVLGCKYLQRFADRPLASLKTIVRGGVDDVDAELHCANDGVCVAHIGSLVG